MKREPAPTQEQAAEVIRHVDLQPLTNKLVGKQIVEMEHCLIEVLGFLTQHLVLSKKIAVEIMNSATAATNRDDFFAAYRDYQQERGSQGAIYANFSPAGRYFQLFLDRVCAHEDKQIEAGKEVTVTHLRMLAALVVRQLESVTAYFLGSDEKLQQQWDYWISAK